MPIIRKIDGNESMKCYIDAILMSMVLDNTHKFNTHTLLIIIMAMKNIKQGLMAQYVSRMT